MSYITEIFPPESAETDIKKHQTITCDTTERLGALELFNLEKSILRGDLLNSQQQLKGVGQEDGAGLLPLVPSDRTSGNQHKLDARRFHSNLRKNTP